MHLRALSRASPFLPPFKTSNLANSQRHLPCSSALRCPQSNGFRRRSVLGLGRGGLVVTCCVNSGNEIVGDVDVMISEDDLKEGALEVVKGEVKEGEIGSQSILSDLKEIVMFTGPAIGLWLCGPLMSLIDTAVIGQGSSIELAALGPGTVLCDNMSYIFMFLSIATSNMVATSLAKKIRGLAWPAILVGWVAQSASLGMKDSWGPLKALAVASLVNAVGDIVLCSFLGYGIAGAAWATMASQVIAGYMMIQALNEKGYNAYAFAVPSPDELMQIVALSAPVFVTMMAKVAFYSLITYFATSMGTHTVAAHQVMIQTYGMCTVCGEPLSQTAQSFMPELLYGTKRNLLKARNLLKSLLIIGATVGLILGSVGTFIPRFFPNIFTSDPAVMKEMHQVLIPYFLALFITACSHSVEGTLLAGRELKFLSLSMSGCFTMGALVLVLVSSRGYGLPGCWYGLVGFQWARFFLALQRLFSPNGVLMSGRHHLEKQKFT